MRFGPSDVRLPLDLLEYLDALYSYALVLSRNQADAEDLVQETCLRALRAMDRLRPDSNPKSWLFTILRNIWLNELRRRQIAPNVGDSDSNEYGANRVADSSKDPYAAYLTDSERERVRHAIEQLPVEFREVILLREYEELSYEEIGVMLQCPVGTVMSRLARARSKLRELVEPTAMPRSATKGADNVRDTHPREIGQSG